jgi:predicted metal-dependent hydrolase
MTATAVSLADRLAAWIVSEGIATGELAVEVAASLLEHESMRSAAEGIGNGGRRLGLLRDGAVALAEIIGADPDEWAAEAYLHGHDGKPPVRRDRRAA